MNRTIILIGPASLFSAMMSRFTHDTHVGISELTIGDTTYLNAEYAAMVPEDLDPNTTTYRYMDPDYEPHLYGATGTVSARLYRRDTSLIHFVDHGPSKSGKTRIWTVHNWRGGWTLGHISWYAPRRRYAFSPLMDTVFDRSCLEEISIFLAWKMSEHKGGRQ